MANLNHGMQISANALNVFGTRVQVTAHNIANISTNDFVEVDARLADGIDGKGVVLNSLMQGDAPAVSTAGAENKPRTEKPSATDLGRAMTRLVQDQRSFEANAKAIIAQDELLGYLMEIKA